MFYVKESPVMADELEIMYKLRSDALLAGIQVFHKFRLSGKSDIMTTCPFHKGGQERKPSFGISRVDGTCHCFACGWVGSVTEMISKLFGYDDNGAYGERWLSRNFLSLSIETRKPLQISLDRRASSGVNVSPAFTEQELDSYRYVHPYMYDRGLTDEIIEKFDVGYDRKTNCVTFPCYYADGSPAFIARRSVKTKFFSYPEEVKKPLYASHLFYENSYNYAVVCESIFNALTCWKWGLPAVALLGTGSYEQYPMLVDLPVRKLILGLDPDEAGNRGAQKIREKVGSRKIITQFDIPCGKDINDLDEEVLNLREFY